MLIVYDSFTGNVQRFVDKLQMRNIKIKDGLIVNEPYVLITYTIGFGEVPQKVLNFLVHNHTYLKGVAGSGNRNWGEMFAKAADIISEMFNVPILHKFELSGTTRDVEIFKQEVEKLVANTKMDTTQ